MDTRINFKIIYLLLFYQLNKILGDKYYDIIGKMDEEKSLKQINDNLNNFNKKPIPVHVTDKVNIIISGKYYH